MIEKPQKSEIPAYMQGYISLVKEDNLFLALHRSLEDSYLFLQKIPANKAPYKYAEGKWSIKDILQHLIDAERVFAYRALRFAREGYGERTGYDQDIFAIKAQASKRDFEDLKNEFISTRKSNIYLFDSFQQEDLLEKGKANDVEISVVGLGFAIIGHALHHFKIIEERYL